MAKKSNKTEHVLKLITKNDDAGQDDLFGLPQELVGNGSAAPAPKADEPSKAEKSKRGKASKAEVPETEVAMPSVPEAAEDVLKATESGSESNPKPNPASMPEPNPASAPEPNPTSVPESNPASVPESNPASKLMQEPESVAESAVEVSAPRIVLEMSGHLINLAEVLVKEKIGLVMEKMKVCTCETCISDITALTLNSLPAKYVTADKGKQSIQLDTYKKQYETDILAALTKACVRVKASPRHMKE